MPGIHIHIIPHPQAIDTPDIGPTAAIIGTIITTASKPRQTLFKIRDVIGNDARSQAILAFFAGAGNRRTIGIRFLSKREGAQSQCVDELPGGSFHPSWKRENATEGKTMKKLLLLPLIAIGLALVPVKQADAQVSIGVGGVGVGFGYPAYGYSYYGYPGYYGGYPYYRTYYYPGRPYYYSGHRVYRHHKHYYRHY
jgi:hypothetical protein